MKRSEMINIIQECDPQMPRWVAKIILEKIEAAGMQLVSDNEAQMWEPEEGWDYWLAEQERKDTARDFEVPEHDESRSANIARAFLAGYDFEALAQDYNLTRERIRQIVCRNRRLYKKEV